MNEATKKSTARTFATDVAAPWAPRFTKFLEAPDIDDIVQGGPTAKRRQQYPLHLKDVKYVDQQALISLPSNSQEVDAFCLEALRWIRDETKLADISKRQLKTAARAATNAFAEHEIREMIDKRLREPIATETPVEWVRMMARTEAEKARRRILGEPIINDKITKDDLQYCAASTKDEIRAQVEKMSYQVQYDFQSWYDQFCLDKVAKYFGVRTRLGIFLLKNLPMGARFSCEVGQGATWKLVAFDMPETVTVATIIDNVRFSATNLEDLLVACTTFEERCAAVG